MIQILIYAMVYLGSALMVYNIFCFIQFARYIREMKAWDGKSSFLYVPIIALSANAYDSDVQNSLKAGMNSHLAKPAEPDKLYETMGRLIAEEQSKQSPEENAGIPVNVGA